MNALNTTIDCTRCKYCSSGKNTNIVCGLAYRKNDPLVLIGLAIYRPNWIKLDERPIHRWPYKFQQDEVVDCRNFEKKLFDTERYRDVKQVVENFIPESLYPKKRMCPNCKGNGCHLCKHTGYFDTLPPKI